MLVFTGSLWLAYFRSFFRRMTFFVVSSWLS